MIYTEKQNHVDISVDVHSPRDITEEMEVRCDCGMWVSGFALGGHIGTGDEIVKECECGKKWTIGAFEVFEE